MRPAAQRALRNRWLLASLLSLAFMACGKQGQELSTAPEADDSDASPQPEDGAADEPIPLIAWVDLLVEDYSEEAALPDTVHDKNIVDDENVGSYEKFFDAEQE